MPNEFKRVYYPGTVTMSLIYAPLVREWDKQLEQPTVRANIAVENDLYEPFPSMLEPES